MNKKAFGPEEHWWLTASLLHVLLQNLKPSWPPLCWVAGASRHSPALACCPLGVHTLTVRGIPYQQNSPAAASSQGQFATHAVWGWWWLQGQERGWAGLMHRNTYHHLLYICADTPCRISATSILIQCSTAKVNWRPRVMARYFFWKPHERLKLFQLPLPNDSLELFLPGCRKPVTWNKSQETCLSE